MFRVGGNSIFLFCFLCNFGLIPFIKCDCFSNTINLELHVIFYESFIYLVIEEYLCFLIGLINGIKPKWDQIVCFLIHTSLILNLNVTSSKLQVIIEKLVYPIENVLFFFV